MKNAGCCSVHTHSTLCDGKNTLEEMAAAACDAGVRYFGASGHSHTPVPLDAGAVLDADMSGYRAAVSALRQAYAGRMEVLTGLEVDSCADVTAEGFDYWIGSVHYLQDSDSGRYYAIDWDLPRLAECCVELFHGDFPALIRQYYADVAAMAARKPTILGHLDIIRKLNGDGSLFDEEDRRYRAAALAALHAADPGVTLLEINTGAMARGYLKTPYPSIFLLREWKAMGGQVILTSDAHRAEKVIFGYPEAAAVAREAGFETGIVLSAAGWEACSL